MRLNKDSILTRTGLLLALTLCLQALGLPPIVSGPLVNGMLIMTALAVGTAGGVMVGALTPWFALTFGIVPPPFFPAIPFIILGNALYVLVFGLFRHLGPGFYSWLGLALASILKFGIIGVGVSFLMDLPAPLAQVLLYPQLLNGLLGGAVALISYRHLYPGLAPYLYKDRR